MAEGSRPVKLVGTRAGEGIWKSVEARHWGALQPCQGQHMIRGSALGLEHQILRLEMSEEYPECVDVPD